MLHLFHSTITLSSDQYLLRVLSGAGGCLPLTAGSISGTHRPTRMVQLRFCPQADGWTGLLLLVEELLTLLQLLFFFTVKLQVFLVHIGSAVLKRLIRPATTTIIIKNEKYTPAVISKISSKLIFASCV